MKLNNVTAGFCSFRSLARKPWQASSSLVAPTNPPELLKATRLPAGGQATAAVPHWQESIQRAPEKTFVPRNARRCFGDVREWRTVEQIQRCIPRDRRAGIGQMTVPFVRVTSISLWLYT